MAHVGGGPAGSIRFALLCRGPRLRDWQARCLDEILQVPGVELVALVIDERAAPSGRRERLGRLASGSARLWHSYNNLYVARRSRALQTVDLTDRLADVPRFGVTVERRGKFSEYFPDDDIARLGDLDLDFALRFAFGIIRGPILDLPRLGVWSFHHGDEERFRGGPPCFWEVNGGAAVTGALLQRLTDRLDAGIVLKKGWFRTTKHSYVRTTDDVHFGSAPWPAQVCRDLRAGVADYLDAPPSESTAPIYRNPGDRVMLRFLGRLAVRTVRSQASAIGWSDQWNVGVVDRSIGELLDGAPLSEPRWFPPLPRSQYIADPFAAHHDGTEAVLVEHYDYRRRLGTVAARTAAGEPLAEPAGLPTGEHVSYPFLLETGGDVYCLPETAASGGVRCYRARDFPLAWHENATLVADVAALDPTVVHHEDRWWLFCTDRSAALTELHVWWSRDLLGPWTPHVSNPVKTDVRSARPAGTPFLHEGQLYRPAQDCSEEYGGAVVINRIDLITPERYRETAVKVVRAEPTWSYGRGLHTISAFGDRLLIDAKRRVFVPRASLFELRARLRRHRR